MILSILQHRNLHLENLSLGGSTIYSSTLRFRTSQVSRKIHNFILLLNFYNTIISKKRVSEENTATEAKRQTAAFNL